MLALHFFVAILSLVTSASNHPILYVKRALKLPCTKLMTSFTPDLKMAHIVLFFSPSYPQSLLLDLVNNVACLIL